MQQHRQLMRVNSDHNRREEAGGRKEEWGGGHLLCERVNKETARIQQFGRVIGVKDGKIWGGGSCVDWERESVRHYRGHLADERQRLGGVGGVPLAADPIPLSSALHCLSSSPRGRRPGAIGLRRSLSDAERMFMFFRIFFLNRRCRGARGGVMGCEAELWQLLLCSPPGWRE